MEIRIGHKRVGDRQRPFIIAEMSANHHSSLDRALQIVEAAAEAGADALKIQTYTADSMTLNLDSGDFFIADDSSLWKGQSLYRLYQQAATPYAWHQAIFDKCKAVGLIGFSSPFDIEAVDFLEQFDVPCYKIASFENIDLPLIQRAASTGKPLIISTGLATLAEIDEAVRTVRQAGCDQFVLLKCTSTYPAEPKQSHIATIPHMKAAFQCPVGLSDHTLGIGAALSAIGMGASVIEKHLTLSRQDKSADAVFSMEPSEFKQLVEEAERGWKAIGNIRYGPEGMEAKSLQFRRTLYVVEDLRKGERITSRHIKAIRPGGGLPPKYESVILGMKVTKPVRKGTPVSWDLFK